MYTDYSPWGIGAILVVKGEIAAWIAGGLDATDEVMLDIRIGDPAGQQAGELVAVLVALRAWRQFWQGRQVQFMVKADNVSALTAVLYLKGGATMKLLCQELALEMAASTLRPAAQHVCRQRIRGKLLETVRDSEGAERRVESPCGIEISA